MRSRKQNEESDRKNLIGRALYFEHIPVDSSDIPHVRGVICLLLRTNPVSRSPVRLRSNPDQHMPVGVSTIPEVLLQHDELLCIRECSAAQLIEIQSACEVCGIDRHVMKS